jgi:ATP-binding cassette subfamily B protein
MNSTTVEAPESFWSELVVICRRMGQVWNLLPKGQRWPLITAVLLMFVGGASNTIIPILMGRMVNVVKDAPPHGSGAAAPDLSHIATMTGWYLGLIGLAYVLREALQIGRRYLVEQTCTRLQQHLFIDVVSHLLMADLATTSQDKVGAIHGRMQRSVGGSVRFLRVGFLDFLPAIFSGGLALATVTAQQPWLGLAMAGIIPISLFITIRQLASQKGVRLELFRCQEDMDGTVVEQLSGIDDIRAANTHEREIRRVTKAAETLRGKEIHHHFVMSLFGSSKAISEGVFHILVLGLSVYLAAMGRISFGDILTYSMLFLSVMAPVNEVHRVIDEGHESSLLVGELMKMMAELPDRSYLTKDARTPELNAEDAIRIEDLRVNYLRSDGSYKTALDGLTLSIKRGETIGIAGRSGCGKTTLLRALLRLVHADEGNVLLGDIPLDSVSRADIAKLIGYVGQSPFVFSGTIAENIAYECPDASEQDIRRAAELACLSEEIEQMAGGYQAIVAERGHNLSGGQKQRLALARIFLKNPPILIFDEATSALDTISERAITEALIELQANRTMILVAHRLSTLLTTDRILLIDEGAVAESGTYDELVAQGGLFADLVESAESGNHSPSPVAAR